MSFSILFVLNFLLCILLMKWASWKVFEQKAHYQFSDFMTKTPLLSARTFFLTKPRPPAKKMLIIRLILSLASLGFIVVFSGVVFSPLSYWEIALIGPSIYFLTESLSLIAQLIYCFHPIPSIHRDPLKSKSLSEFWGKRWNQWVQDWLRDLTKYRFQKTGHRLIATFVISGFFHEMMVNLPYFLFFKKNNFGSMMLYFAIQGLGIWIERKWFRNSSTIFKRIFLWLWLILPAPLFLGPPILIFFGIIHE